MAIQRQRRHAASSADNLTHMAMPFPPSRSSTVDTNRSSVHTYDPYLIRDTFDLPDTHLTPLRRSHTHPSRASSWDIYLYETSQLKEDMESDKSELRNTILSSMKQYYGKRQWEKIDVFENCELCNEDERFRPYLDQVIVYGDEGSWRRRAHYFDRCGREVDRAEFERKGVEQADTESKEGRLGFLWKLPARLAADVKAFA